MAPLDVQPLSGPAERGPLGRTGTTPTAVGAARRRRALMRLAERNGEVRLAVRDGSGLRPEAAKTLDLLDDLNELGLLRYGGLQRSGAQVEIVYRRS